MFIVELRAFLLDSILIFIGMLWWNIYLLKRLDSTTQINHSYNYIFNQSNRNLFLIKTDGSLLQINQNALDCYGLIQQNIQGKPLWLVFSGISSTNKEQLQKAIIQAARGEIVSIDINSLQQKDRVGNYKFFFTPIVNKKAKVTVILAEACNIDQAEISEFQIHQELLHTFF